MSRTSNFSPSPSNSLRTVSLSPSIKANNFFSKMKNMMKLQSLIPNKDKKNQLEEEQFLLKPSASTGLYITRKKLTTSSKNKKLCRRKTSIENDNDKEKKLYLVPKIRKRNSAINVNTKELMTSTSYNRYKLKNTDRILLANMQIIDRNRIRKIKDMTPKASAERKITFLASGALEIGLTMFSMWLIGYETRVFSVTDLSAKSIFPLASTVTFSSNASRLIAL